MKNLIYSLYLLFPCFVFSQNPFNHQFEEIEPVDLVVTYQMKYQEDSLNPYFIKQEDMILLLGKKTSKYLSYNYYYNDSVTRGATSFAEFERIVSDPARQLPLVRFQLIVYKNYPAGKISTLDHIIGGSFKYEEEINLFHWELCQDTMKIEGLKAQKAICSYGGRKWIAWFCPEIPFNDGPYKFCGLPGLIIELNDTRNHYVFELVAIKKSYKGQTIDIDDKENIVTTKLGFFKAEDAFRNDVVNRAKEAGLNTQEQQAIFQKLASRNNPIELIRK